MFGIFTMIMATKPKFKKKCIKCGKFSFIKLRWNYCMECWEKENGKYEGEDRDLYI